MPRSEDWWPARRGDLVDSLHNTGEVSSRPDEVQDDVKMPSLIQPEVASVVPCQRNAAAATSLLTFCKRNYLLQSRAGNRRPVSNQHLEDSHGIKSLANTKLEEKAPWYQDQHIVPYRLLYFVLVTVQT